MATVPRSAKGIGADGIMSMGYAESVPRAFALHCSYFAARLGREWLGHHINSDPHGCYLATSRLFFAPPGRSLVGTTVERHNFQRKNDGSYV